MRRSAKSLVAIPDEVRAKRNRRYALAGLVLAWEAVMRLGIVSPLFAASPSAVARSIVEMSSEASVGSAMITTLAAMVLGFVIAAVTGTIAGVAAGRLRLLSDIIEPVVMMVYSTPKIIFLPLMVLILGLGFGLKVAYAAFAAFFAVLLNVAAGVRQVKPIFLTTAQSLGASRWQTFWHFLVPSALPAIIVAMWYGIRQAVTSVLIAELFVSGGAGLGTMIRRYTQAFQVDRVWALILALSVVAIAFSQFWRWVEERVAGVQMRHAPAADGVGQW